MPPAFSDDQDERTRDTYQSAQNRTLMAAIIETIAEHHGTEEWLDEFVLYEDVDPDALSNLFRHEGNANIAVQFDTDDVRVLLESDDDVEIHVTDQQNGLLGGE